MDRMEVSGTSDKGSILKVVRLNRTGVTDESLDNQ